MWGQPMFEGKAPSSRYDHTATVIGNIMYIIGGKGDHGACSDIYTLHLGKFIFLIHIFHLFDKKCLVDVLFWEKMDSTTWMQFPGALYGHSSIHVRNFIFVFGGIGRNELLSNDLWIFDLNLNIWSRPSVRGTKPSARSHHIASLVGKNMFVSGGSTHSEYLSDVYYLCTETLVWYCSTISGDEPAPRFGHTASEINQTQFTYGGKKAKSCSNDVYALVILISFSSSF